jgi:hypothetical protein
MDALARFSQAHVAELGMQLKWEQSDESQSLQFLRELVRDSISKLSFQTAAFFADKLVTLAHGM